MRAAGNKQPFDQIHARSVKLTQNGTPKHWRTPGRFAMVSEAPTARWDTPSLPRRRDELRGGRFEAAMDRLDEFRSIKGLFKEGLGVVG